MRQAESHPQRSDGCSCRGPLFGYQDPHGGSLLPVIPVPGDSTLLQTYMISGTHVVHRQTQNQESLDFKNQVFVMREHCSEILEFKRPRLAYQDPVSKIVRLGRVTKGRQRILF